MNWPVRCAIRSERGQVTDVYCGEQINPRYNNNSKFAHCKNNYSKDKNLYGGPEELKLPP